jgi:RNA polymerase sigma-70 factor (ECF subfamily)
MSTTFDTATKRASVPPEAGVPGFSEKYQEYFPRVFAFIYSRVGQTHLAEDLAADVFERAYRNLDSLRSDAAFTTWLFTIARNVIISSGRKRGRETIVDPDVIRDLAPSEASVETQVLREEELKDLSAVVRTFPQREQDIISLKFDAELPNAEIAAIMGISEPNVRVIMFRTLRKLRDIMAAQRAR